MQQKWEGANREISIIKASYCQQTHLSSKYMYKKCDHPQLSTEQSQRKQWLEMGSAAHEKLVKIISDKTLVADLEHMTEQVNTTLLEVFQAKKISYLPKSTFFRMDKMVAGTQIAALDHNNNINRSQVSKFLHI